MKKNNYRNITIVTYILISILAIGMTLKYVISKEKELLAKTYNSMSVNIKNKISSLIEKKKNATLALTITLSNNTQVINIIKQSNNVDNNLTKLSLLLRKETAFKNVWFQVIDKNGISLHRSWSDKKGDAVHKVRPDLREMLKNPTIKSTISVGKYDMTFKAMVPVYENGEFIGVIESITHFNSISRGLRISNDIEPVIIVEERFTDQLKFPFTNLFVDNHYIANVSAKKEIIDYIDKVGVKKVIQIDDYIVDGNYLITNYEIIYNNKKLASFITLKDKDSIDISSIIEFKENALLYLGLFIILLGLVLYAISYSIYSRELTVLYEKLTKNQKELKDLNASLKQTVEDEVEKNNEKNRVLFHQSKLAAMGEMMENIAHQWRQPLSIITTAASGIKLKKELEISSEKDEIESLDTILNSAQHLSNTIDDFRNFFSQEKVRNTFEVDSFIQRVSSLVEIEYKNKNIRIVKNIVNFSITTYENELLQIILNLLNNAKDEFVKNKELEEKLIFINIYYDEENSYIEVVDNAGGVKEDIIDRVFEPYFTTKHKSQGTGIGLYMSQEITVKHLKGKISVENVEYDYENSGHKGAKFKITIPR